METVGRRRCVSCSLYDARPVTVPGQPAHFTVPGPEGLCRRFPTPVPTTEADWCGEHYQTRSGPALDASLRRIEDEC